MPEKTSSSLEQDSQIITIVSGLPRSGTSMMMQMLSKGGLEALTDARRVPDKDNPRGYFEYEKATELALDSTWIPEAQGKVVKIVAQLLPYLPRNYRYRIVFMERKIEEVLASQTEMLRRLGRSGATLTPDQLKEAFQKQVNTIKRKLAKREETAAIYINYHKAVEKPLETAEKLKAFLGGTLDAEAMARVVDPALYRQRF